MSNENVNSVKVAAASTANQANPGLLKEMGSSVALSGAITGFGGITSAIRNGGVTKALKATNVEGFRALNENLKAANKDIFTRGVELSQNYDVYKAAAKRAKKLENAVKRGDIGLWEKFKNLFRSEKLDITKLQQQSAEAAKDLAKKKSIIASGGDIIEEGAKLAGKSGLGTAKNLFKSELKNKFVLGITILGAIPRIKEEVIPAFKEKGFIEGLKTTGKVIARTATDFVSNAGFSAIGRAVGGAIGSIFPGVGTAIGGMFGDVIGSFFSMKLTEKIFDKNKKAKEAEIATQQAAAAEVQPQVQAQSVQTAPAPAVQDNLSPVKKAELVTDTFESAKAKYSTDPASAKKTTTVKRKKPGYVKPVDGKYQTGWVNNMKEAHRADYTV